MAIRIPILTSFDPKGLRQANASFAKLQSSVGSLGRNFAAAGVVIAGAGALIGRSLNDAAESQRALAQTEATLKSTGTTANGTAKEIAALASSLQKSTAFNDEAILSGQNLLLTFKGIQNQAGEGNNIFDQASATMLDFARAMNTGPSEAAIKLGKALQDPTRGVTALRKSGVDFTKDQMNMIKALQESGDLMGAQKIVLAELQSQFGGSAAAFAKTFTGQLQSMNNELNDLSEEIGFMVMPAVTGLVTELRALIPVIGPQLKAAIASVDFKALAKSVVDLTTFLITNAQAITNTVIALFALNTAYKVMAVGAGIAKVATDLYKWSVAQAAAGTALATTATTIFSTALKLIPFVAVLAGIGLIIAGIMEADSSYRKTTPVVTSFGETMLKTGHDAEWAASKYGVATDAVNNFSSAVSSMPTVPTIDIPVVGGGRGLDLSGIAAASAGRSAPSLTTSGKGGKGAKSKKESISAALKREGRMASRETRLLNTGISAGFADMILSTTKSSKGFKKVLGSLTKNSKSASKLQAKFNKTKAGKAELASIAAEEASVAAAAAAARAARLAEQKRVYESFLESVKTTFANIKNTILGAFDLPQLGSSTDAIIRNMNKLLDRTRKFATNISKLAGLGLNATLLQQVIAQGPMAGAALAEALTMGGPEALAGINAGYAEFGNLAGQIATTGTNAMFGTQAQQNVYNINVNGGVGSGATIGQAIVQAIKDYERVSGAVWQGA